MGITTVIVKKKSRLGVAHWLPSFFQICAIGDIFYDFEETINKIRFNTLELRNFITSSEINLSNVSMIHHRIMNGFWKGNTILWVGTEIVASTGAPLFQKVFAIRIICICLKRG